MIYIGADHRGYKLKEIIKAYLTELDIFFDDLGAKELIPDDDYPDHALLVAQKVAENLNENKGILICGSGVGVDIVANKIKGIRSALCFNIDQARASRNDDNVNILSLAADYITEDLAKEIVKMWLETPFSGGENYSRRLEKIKKIEES